MSNAYALGLVLAAVLVTAAYAAGFDYRLAGDTRRGPSSAAESAGFDYRLAGDTRRGPSNAAESTVFSLRPMTAESLVAGFHVIIRERPCKITDVIKSKTGKHGHAKVSITAVDIFTGEKHMQVFPSHETVYLPGVARHEYIVIGLDDEDFVTILLDDGNTRKDLKFSDNEVAESVRKGLDSGKVMYVTILRASVPQRDDEEQIVDYREAPPHSE